MEDTAVVVVMAIVAVVVVVGGSVVVRPKVNSKKVVKVKIILEDVGEVGDVVVEVLIFMFAYMLLQIFRRIFKF